MKIDPRNKKTWPEKGDEIYCQVMHRNHGWAIELVSVQELIRPDINPHPDDYLCMYRDGEWLVIAGLIQDNDDVLLTDADIQFIYKCDEYGRILSPPEDGDIFIDLIIEWTEGGNWVKGRFEDGRWFIDSCDHDGYRRFLPLGRDPVSWQPGPNFP